MDVVGKGGELPDLHNMIDRLQPELPGMMGVVFDGAPRGSDHEHLIREHGLQLISPPTAHRAAEDPDDVRIEKRHRLEMTDARHPDRTSTPVEIWAEGGHAAIAHHREDGTQFLEQLTRGQVQRRENSDGTYRWYGVFTTPDDGSVTLSYLSTEEDVRNKIIRAEYLRTVAPGDDDYATLYGSRNDAEGINSQYANRLPNDRSPVYGKRRLLAHALAWAIVPQRRRRQPVPPEPTSGSPPDQGHAVAA